MGRAFRLMVTEECSSEEVRAQARMALPRATSTDSPVVCRQPYAYFSQSYSILIEQCPYSAISIKFKRFKSLACMVEDI
ncbi:unnamed protein product [Sympodiomycopsis kandeliae]